MESAIKQQEHNQNDRKSSILSLLLFLLLLLALVIPIFSYQIPPPEQEGIAVSFGNPNTGQGNSQPIIQQEVAEEESKASQEEQQEVEEEVVEKEKPKPSPVPPPKEVLTSKVEKEVVVPKSTAKANEKSAEQKAAEAEQKRLEEEKAAKAAAAKAEAEQKAKFEESKKQFGEFLSGSGKGETATSGNQGDPSGDPNAQNLSQISSGSGRVGGGLSNRGVVYEPEIKDNSQKTGKVVMKVCVDAQGKVTEAAFTQRGSTTVDGELLDKAKKAAEKYRFSPSEVEEQCGVITFEFKVE